ncbi:MAG TPA: UvrD-helicase domain-containing protein [Rhabdochlamydiaceae bacterium]|nr:UvrD-helicase domain-containing protein [Rhabdochlamydiaceae bacterium]
MLNSAQEKAVKSTQGKVLVLAGAGSGKTKVIVHRIAYLIEHLNVDPSKILGLTFTNKAAKEMRERISHLLSAQIAKKITLCTFHSFCMQVLRSEIERLGYTKEFTLYDERSIRRLLLQIGEEAVSKKEISSIDEMMEKISLSKNRGSLPDEKIFGELFGRLQTCLRAYNAVDFDSLLSLTAELFENHPAALKKYQEKYHYIMIDEYQDTNPIQYRIAKMLSNEHQNLCVVGDDDQSIYGWRGAEIKNILDFDASTIIKLQQNYRSTPMILNAANAVIANNTKRHPKELFSKQEPGEPIVLFHAPTPEEEADAAIQRLLWLRKTRNLKWSAFAILYRSNLLSRPFEMALMKAMWERNGSSMRGIPYQIFGGTEFYERSEIKDLLAYLRAIVNPLDEEALLRIINVPRRGISEKTLDQLTAYSRDHKIPLWEVLKKPDSVNLSPRGFKATQHFIEIIERAKTTFKMRPLDKALTTFIDEVGLKRAIEEEVKDEKARQFKWENILNYVEALKQYEETTDQEEISLHHFLTSSGLDQSQFSEKGKMQHQDAVNLMTFHSAKGLEFEACFLVALEDHLLPHEKSLKETGIEEERRLFYVALTRAKQYLTLSMSKTRKRTRKAENSNPSRFLFEIPKELIRVVSHRNPI